MIIFGFTILYDPIKAWIICRLQTDIDPMRRLRKKLTFKSGRSEGVAEA